MKSEVDQAEADLIRVLDAELLDSGFRRRGRVWSRSTSETRCRLKLSRDRWKPMRYSLDLEVALPRLLREGDPASECHLGGSMYSEALAEVRKWNECLHVGLDCVDGEPRLKKLVEVFREQVAPVLRGAASMAGIEEMLRAGRLKAMAISAELQQITGHRVLRQE